MKMLRGTFSGLAQLQTYMKTERRSEGWLVVFETRAHAAEDMPPWFIGDRQLRIDFADGLKQFVVELRADEERCAHKRIELWTNRLEQACALRRDQRSKGANHIQASCLSRAPCWKVVENDPVGRELDGERQCLPLAVTQAPAQQRRWWQDTRRLYSQPGRE